MHLSQPAIEVQKHIRLSRRLTLQEVDLLIHIRVRWVQSSELGHCSLLQGLVVRAQNPGIVGRVRPRPNRPWQMIKASQRERVPQGGPLVPWCAI